MDRPPNANNFKFDAAERRLVSNVVHAYDAFSSVSELRRVIQVLDSRESNCQYNSFHTVHLMASAFNGIKSFISSTPDFKILTLSEQHSLFQRNLIGLLFGSFICSAYETSTFRKNETSLLLSNLYTKEEIGKIDNLFKNIDGDLILIKLLILALGFSSNCYVIDYNMNHTNDILLLGTYRLLGSQNVYVEALWKYLVYTHGFNRAVLLYSKIIKQFLDIFSVSMHFYKTNQVHQIFLDEVVKQVQKCNLVDEQSVVPLWGKQT